MASLFCIIFISHTHTKYVLTVGNFWNITLDLSKTLQTQTCTYVRDSLYTSLINSHCWNKKVSFCTMRVISFLHVITKTCLLCVISDCTPSMGLNYAAVPCHCCWHTAFTCFNLSPFWKMIVSFSTVLVSVHLALSIFISFYIREIQVEYASGYMMFIFIAMVHDSGMQKWKSLHMLKLL